MNEPQADLESAVSRWRDTGWPRPDVLLVSGSGLGVDLGEPIAEPLPLSHWLPFPTHQVEGHPLRTQLLEPRTGLRVLYQQGRLHSYQGYDAHQTVAMVRLAARLGAHTLIMTNAAGGIHPDFRPGDLVAIRDHLNLIGLNPLRGLLPETWGPQFPDMSSAYDPELRAAVIAKAAEAGIDLPEGVYAAVAGPSYETPSEVRMLQVMGADLVGMSTALEVIAARHMGLRCVGLSLVANAAAGVEEGPMDHAEVLAAAVTGASRLQSLLSRLLTSEILMPA